MMIIQTKEMVWRIDEVALAEHAEPEYWDWVESAEGTIDDFFGFVKASVEELGTEVFGLELIYSDNTFHFVEDDE